MSNENDKPAASHLQQKLGVLDALYQRFGRDGLKDLPLHEVTMLLTSKELQFRDTPKGRDLAEGQKAANRTLEMEVRDINAHVNALLAGAGLYGSRTPRLGYGKEQDQQQRQPPKDRAKGIEPER